MYIEIRLFALSPTDARIVALDTEAGVTAGIWSSEEEALVLLVDHRENNRGASVTNACDALIPVVFMHALGNRDQGHIRWFECDASGHVDEILIDAWLGDHAVSSYHSPYCNRTIEAFDRLLLTLPHHEEDPTASFLVSRLGLSQPDPTVSRKG